ncbi:hypothetical protein ACFL2A_07505 [Thermodesulfobacteriota bacterium]
MNIINNVRAIMRDGAGKVIRMERGHNNLTAGVPSATVFNARVLLLMLLSGDNDSTNLPFDISALTTMELGTGTTPGDSGLSSPYAPSGSTIESIETWTWDYSTSQTSIDITASTTWDSTYGALSNVNEVAIYNNSDEAFAYKKFNAALSKSSAGSITIEWKFTLS